MYLNKRHTWYLEVLSKNNIGVTMTKPSRVLMTFDVTLTKIAQDATAIGPR
jgi:hypothetical protein